MTDDLFPTRGEVAALMRETDWSRTALGPAETWPLSLRTVIRLMLTSRFAMWMGWGPDLLFFYNDAYREQTLGLKHPWALARPAHEVWAEIWEDLAPRVRKVMASGEATWDEGLLLFLERSGFSEETYHTFSYSPVPDDQGRTAGLFCVVIEDTERVIGERRIALLRRFATQLAETQSTPEVFSAVGRALSSDAHDFSFSIVYMFDDDGVTARRASLTTMENEHPGAPEIVRLGDAESPWPLRDALMETSPLIVDLPAGYTWPKGSWNQPPTKAVLAPLQRQGQPRPAGVFIAGLSPHRPIDDSIRSFAGLLAGQLAAGLANAQAYEAEKKRVEALAALDRAKTSFFGNVSHEFRTPLTLMLGPLSDVLESPDISAKAREELSAVHRNGLRLLKLVNTLLDFTRIEAGRVQAIYQATDLSALTIDLASAFRSAVEKANMELRVACPKLPEKVFVDRDMWEKIVLNLVSNAFKHTFEGSIDVVLHIDEGHVVLDIKDTGVGIPKSEVPHLFERFHRVRGNRSRSIEGTGIGLALVQELVRLHRGTISVTSEVGIGTTVSVRIPLGVAHLPADHLQKTETIVPKANVVSAYVDEARRWLPETDDADLNPTAERVAAPKDTRDRWSILVADDNADVRAYVSRLLEEHWDVEVVNDGHAALAAVHRRAPDLILSDVMMPGLDGFKLIEALRSDPRTEAIPIILLSARAGEDAAVEGLASGANDYLIKPFSSRELIARVATHIGLGKARAAEREAQQRLHALFDQAPVAVSVISGPALRFDLANPRYARMVGRADLVGKTFREAFPELAEDAPVIVMLQRVRESGVAFTAREYKVPLKDETTGELRDFYFLFTCQPVREHDGAVETILTVVVDVTEQVELRRDVENLAERERAARGDAEEANRSKDDFLATVSHELRTPLNAIVGWSSILRGDRGKDPATVRKALEVIDRSARAQTRIIEDILDVSRIITGKMRLETKPGDLTVTVQEGIDSIRHAAGEALRAYDETVALIVSDLGMPAHDGYWFLKELRKRDDGKRVPVIALTAYARSGDESRALAAGFVRYISKPTVPENVLNAASEVLKDDSRETRRR